MFIPNNSIFPAPVKVDLIKARLQALDTHTPIPMLTVATPVHVPVEPKTVYVVFAKGEAVTFEPFAELNVAEGNQV